MSEVGIADAAARYNDVPHHFSGGQRQRIVIAAALANDPKLLIADEPTTALDVTIQAQVLQLIDRLRRDHGTTVLLITHDLGVVSMVCDRVGVMYGGRLLETAKASDLFRAPTHPYTRDTTETEIAAVRTPPAQLAAELAQYSQLLKLPANMDLFLVGEFDSDTIGEMVRKSFGGYAFAQGPRLEVPQVGVTRAHVALSGVSKELQRPMSEMRIAWNTGVGVTIIYPGFIRTGITQGRIAKMPYLMDLEPAVKKIVSAIEKEKNTYAFPWQLATIVRSGLLMPVAMYDWIAGRNSFRE